MPDSTTHSEFADIFSRSREILLAHSRSLVLVRDEPGDIYLNTAHQMKNGQPLFFGAAAIRKRYVSFHLMPVYVFPELLHSIPTQLERRRQPRNPRANNRYFFIRTLHAPVLPVYEHE